MVTSELRELSDSELEEKLNEFKDELFKLRFQLVTGQLDNVARLKQVRRNIARVMTVQRQRELEAATEAASGAGQAGQQQ